MGKNPIYNYDGSVRMEVGWIVKLNPQAERLQIQERFLNKELEVSDIWESQTGTAISFKGYTGRYYIGWFMRAARKFKVGDRVQYLGTKDIELLGKALKVKGVQMYGNDTHQFLIFEGSTRQYTAESFKLQEFPNFKETLFDFCTNDVIKEDTKIYFDIRNPDAKKLGLSYTKNDLLTVLRILEKNHVKAEVSFDSDLSDCIVITLKGEELMDELGNNEPKTLPVTALEALCNAFEVYAFVEDHAQYYVLGFDCVIYETKDAVSPVQAAN